jgi:hypothetical protein
MESSGSSDDRKRCCCVDRACYKLGSSLDVSGCYERGGKVVKSCHDCR